MKKIKIITGVLLVIVGMLVLISGLFNKKEQEVVIEQTTIGNKTQINNETTITSTTTTTTTKTTKKVVKKNTTKSNTTKQSVYKLTHYGWDCKGCRGNTAIGYNVRNTIYYNDSQFGKVRICAMSKSMPLYSVIKIKNYKLGGDITCIVIDRGVGSGVIDLLTESEKKSSQLGIQRNVQIEILRKGR